MANLIVRNVDDAIADALKARARNHGISAEAEHRRILTQALTVPKKHGFIEALSEIPDVGDDSDFERVQNGSPTNVISEQRWISRLQQRLGFTV